MTEVAGSKGDLPDFKIDEIGYWSEIKLDIIKRYATEYSRILTNQQGLEHWYIDAFSGAGVHRLKGKEDLVLGSPRIALEVTPPFKKYVFIDLEKDKTEWLRGEVGDRDDVAIFTGDCNSVLLDSVFNRFDWETKRRGLCVLDPYGLHLHWNVVMAAGKHRTIEIFLNFPVYDININVLHTDPKSRKTGQAERMNRFWGDDSWEKIVYASSSDLFGESEETKIARVAELVKQYTKRLRTEAGFSFVAEPIPMRNNSGGIIYYLLFASPKATGAKIVSYIFDKYRNYGVKAWPQNPA